MKKVTTTKNLSFFFSAISEGQPIKGVEKAPQIIR